MATESPLIHDGSQTISGFDARNSAQSSTVRMGPSGSGQFLAVRLSTTADRTTLLSTVTGAQIYGILQNKPSTGIAADIGIFGITKAVGGSTFGSGVDLMADTSGCLIPYTTTTTNQDRVGRSHETVSAVGQVFTAALYGFGQGGGAIVATTA